MEDQATLQVVEREVKLDFTETESRKVADSILILIISNIDRRYDHNEELVKQVSNETLNRDVKHSTTEIVNQDAPKVSNEESAKVSKLGTTEVPKQDTSRILNQESTEVSKQEKRNNSPACSPIVKRKKVGTQLPVNTKATTVTIENLEEVQLELNNFEQQAKVFAIEQTKLMLPADIPSILEGYLEFVAKCGYTYFSWSRVKLLFETKLNNVAQELSYTLPMTQSQVVNPNVEKFNFDVAKATLFNKMESYEGIPFTVQRIAELLTSHKHYYKTTEKYMRALEKVMRIVSTMEISPYVEEKKKSSLLTQRIFVPPPSPNSEPDSEGNPMIQMEGRYAITKIIMEAVVKPEDITEDTISNELSGSENWCKAQEETSIDTDKMETMDVDLECSSNKVSF